MKKIITLILVFSLCFAFVSCAWINKDKADEKIDEKADEKIDENTDEKIDENTDEKTDENTNEKTDEKEYDDKYVAEGDDEKEVSYPQTTEQKFTAFLDKLDRFAAKLTYEIYADSDKQTNFAISPVSVYMALALATECSNGETRDEILNAVGVTYYEVRSFTTRIYSLCNQEYTYRDMEGEKDISGFLELANSIWADNDVELKANGVNNLATNYNCDLFKVDFATDEGKNAISDYIKKKTHGLIDGNIDLPPETLITLINTFYLKDVWDGYSSGLGFTKNTYDFVNADGSITSTKLMYGDYCDGRVYEGEGYTSFFTRTDHCRINFIVPMDGYTLEEVFTAENIYKINNIKDYGYIDYENMQLHYTRVFFPKYEASFDEDIANILINDFGINSLFNFGNCDFTNITDAKVSCGGVVHKCKLIVDEFGIEGAAITTMPMPGAGEGDQFENIYHRYDIDRAFGFVITDSYGNVLFSGVVNNIN